MKYELNQKSNNRSSATLLPAPGVGLGADWRTWTAILLMAMTAPCVASDPDPSLVNDLRSCWWISSVIESGSGPNPPTANVLLGFRKSFLVEDPAVVSEGWVAFAADDRGTLYLNGTKIGEMQRGLNPDFTTAFGSYHLPSTLLRKGENTITVRVENSPETATGLIGKFTLFEKGAPPRFIPMDASWKCFEGEPPQGWMEAGFDDSSWRAAVAVQPNSQGSTLIGYAPASPDAKFPEFLAPGSDRELALLRDLYNWHLNGLYTSGSLWDQWIPRAIAWPATADDPRARPQFQAVRQNLLLRNVSPEGYVSTHQIYGLGHPEGWPFPLWTQSAGVGWHFSMANMVYRDEFGIFPTKTVDAWTLDDAKTLSVGEPEGWVIQTDENPATITSPPFDVGKPSFTYLRMEWLAPDLPRDAQPYLEWSTASEPEFSPDRRVYFSPPPPTARIPFVSMVKLPESIDLETRITRIRIRPGNAGPTRIAIKSLMSAVETRHNVNNPSYILGMADFTAWSGDLSLLREALPKMRSALAYFLRKYRVREEKMVVTPDIGKDGRSGIEFTADGTKVIKPGRGIGNSYFDILPFGGRDTIATYLGYAAILRMADIEEQVAAHPEWGVGREGAAFDPADLRQLAAEIKAQAAPYLFNKETGRFIGAEDLVDGRRWDYGFVFTNNEAIYHDFALPDQAEKIRDWLDGKRIVEGDTSQGKDIYKFRFGPRMTTRRNLDWYIHPWTSPELIPWGGQVQDGGSVLGFSYHDLMAILKVRGPDATWERLKEIIAWYEDTRKAGGYSEYYSGKKANEESSLQGDGIGTGGLGIMREFLESLLLPQVVIDGFLGLTPRLDGLAIQPQLPSAWPSLTITRIAFHGAIYSVTARADGSITVDCTGGELIQPSRLFPPAGAWKTADGRLFSSEEAARGVPLPARANESLSLTPASANASAKE